MSTSGKETIISSEGRKFDLLDTIMEEATASKRICYWARRSEVRKMFESGVKNGNIEYFVGRENPGRETASYRVIDTSQVMIGCCDFFGEDATKLKEWATGKKNKNKNEENGRMITVKNDCDEKFALGATEMRQLPNGYKMQRKDLKAAIASYKLGRYMDVAYGFTDALDTRMGAFEDDGNNSITIGCCNFYNEEADKLRKWAMAERKTNGSTGTRKRIGAGKNSKRKATPRNTRNASRARTSKARPRKKSVAARANRTRAHGR